MDRILVIGAGLLGSRIIEAAGAPANCEVHGADVDTTLGELGCEFHTLDITNKKAVSDLITSIRPSAVFHTAALTNVDRCELDKDAALRINGTASGNIALACAKVDAYLCYISTDYIFDGAKTEPYVETDPPNPLGVYGRSKLAGDEAVRAVGGAHLIFRLCWVYGARGQNFMLTMMRLAREREKLRVVSDQVGCPTWSRMIAETTTLALKQAIAADDLGSFTGTYHLASSGTTSWHGFADAIVKLMPAEGRKCVRVEAISTAEYPTPTKRPAYSVLSCDKLERTFGLRLPHWEDSLKQVLEGI